MTDFCGQYGNIEIRTSAIHVTAGGEQILIIHGHELDTVVQNVRWLAFAGDVGADTVSIALKDWRYAHAARDSAVMLPAGSGQRCGLGIKRNNSRRTQPPRSPAPSRASSRISWAAKSTRLDRSGAVPSRPSTMARSRSRVLSGADTLFIGMLPGAPATPEGLFSCLTSGRVHPNPNFQQS